MHGKFNVKTLQDGRAMLNLGCGVRMDGRWNNLDFSPYARLAKHLGVARILNRVGFLSQLRYENLLHVDRYIIAWDLRKGIPFAPETFDVVYHSHLLEHIDKDSARSFLQKCYCVLKKGGILRIVVPNLKNIVDLYISSLSRLEEGDNLASNDYEKATHDLFDQMVRKKRTGTQMQRRLVRVIERIVLGGPERSGQLHRWMYDRYSLGNLLSNVGFREVEEHSRLSSKIEGWEKFYLDVDEEGTVHKPGSLYMEGVK